MGNEPSRGPEVPQHEDLLRGILYPDWWDPDAKHLSSGVFGYKKFSANIASMTTADSLLERFASGSGLVRFNSGKARELGFDARHEPENGDNSHAHVYCDLDAKKRKTLARKLVEASTIIKEPDIEKLRSMS